MSIFNIFNNSNKPSNKANVKYQEQIISNDKSAKTNKNTKATHHSLDFLNFISLSIGNTENQIYNPIFSNGSIPDAGNTYGLSSIVYQHINNAIASAQNTIFGNSNIELDPNQISNYMTEFDQRVDAIVADKIESMTDAEILTSLYENLYDPDQELLKIIGPSNYYGDQ
jgi:hypothetical protein